MAMTTLHAAVGIAIVKVIPNPAISLPLALLSHVLLDLYPEWYDKQNRGISLKNFGLFDWKEKTLGITQGALLIMICGYLIAEHNIFLLAGAILANIFDLIDEIYVLISKQRDRSLWFFHPNGWWPFKINFNWQGFGIGPLQNTVLDALFVSLFLFL